MANSWILGANVFGMKISLAGPPEFAPSAEFNALLAKEGYAGGYEFTNDPMEAHVIGFEMWVKAVEKVKSTDPDKVIDALPGIEAKNLTGGTSKMLPNHHITKPVFIGEIKANGQFDVVWKTPGLVAGDAWSKELDGSKDLIGDWVGKKCGNYNTKTNKCGGQGS